MKISFRLTHWRLKLCQTTNTAEKQRRTLQLIIKSNTNLEQALNVNPSPAFMSEIFLAHVRPEEPNVTCRAKSAKKQQMLKQ